MIERAGLRRPSRHLLQQPLPRDRLGAADGEGGPGSRRGDQGRQGPPRLPPRWCWPAGAAVDRCRCSISSRGSSTRRSPPARPATATHHARAHPGRRHHAAGRAHQSARHADQWLDASILDESGPARRDPELDLYNPANPNQPPYSAEFRPRYRRAQIDRNRRITAWVKGSWPNCGRPGGPTTSSASWCGTMADPRWLDPAVDPNDRTPGTCYLGDPAVVNMRPGRPGALLQPAQLAVPVEL